MAHYGHQDRRKRGNSSGDGSLWVVRHRPILHQAILSHRWEAYHLPWVRDVWKHLEDAVGESEAPGDRSQMLLSRADELSGVFPCTPNQAAAPRWQPVDAAQMYPKPSLTKTVTSQANALPSAHPTGNPLFLKRGLRTRAEEAWREIRGGARISEDFDSHAAVPASGALSRRPGSGDGRNAGDQNAPKRDRRSRTEGDRVEKDWEAGATKTTEGPEGQILGGSGGV